LIFSAVVKDTQNQKVIEADNKLRDAINDINPDDLAPRDALDLIYKLKKEYTNFS